MANSMDSSGLRETDLVNFQWDQCGRSDVSCRCTVHRHMSKTTLRGCPCGTSGLEIWRHREALQSRSLEGISFGRGPVVVATDGERIWVRICDSQGYSEEGRLCASTNRSVGLRNHTTRKSSYSCFIPPLGVRSGCSSV